jgi:plastocyanin
MFNKKTAVVLIAIAAPLVAVAGDAAGKKTVSQKNREFSVQAITVKKGETVVFRNDDSITHNIFANVVGNEFSQVQEPGKSSEVTFQAAGTVQVRCAIHPKMKLTVNVTE